MSTQEQERGSASEQRQQKNPYWRHLFSRHKLRGDWITWSFGQRWWLRMGRVIVWAEYIRPNAKVSEGEK